MNPGSSGFRNIHSVVNVCADGDCDFATFAEDGACIIHKSKFPSLESEINGLCRRIGIPDGLDDEVTCFRKRIGSGHFDNITVENGSISLSLYENVSGGILPNHLERNVNALPRKDRDKVLAH